VRNFKFHNLTNLYTKTNPSKIANDFKRVLEQSRNGICGIEIKSNRGGTDFTLVSPSFLKQNGIIRGSNKNHLSEDNVFLEGYLSEPFFLPLCTVLDGEFIERIQSLSFILKDNETIFIQWLFKRTSNYQEKAIQMYSSYILLGNDYPLTLNIGRKFQEKVINLTNKLGRVAEVRDYIEEAEKKIVSEGYCFKLIVAMNCSLGRQDYIRNRLEGIFNQYTYYNGIKFAEVKGKNLIQQIDDCIMTHDTKYQILSKREILSLIGGNDFDEVEEAEMEVVDEGGRISGKSGGSGVIVKDAIELLPNYPIQEVVEREGILQEIAEALKRVGVTSQARVYNGEVTTGIRLTSITCDIPKNKNLTDLTKKQKDIQASLGVQSLSIEQGEFPDTVKFSIPNDKPSIVGLRTMLEQDSFKEFCKENSLPFVVGLTELNDPIYLSLAKLPHLLVTGTTGSGKSVFLNNLATTLMLMNSPDELLMVMIDPKMVEFQHFVNFVHVKEVITDMDKAELTLLWLVKEMDDRYAMFSKVGVKSITAYNEAVNRNGLDSQYETIPSIVCIIDELGDLMDTHPEVENHIIRLGQKSRMAGVSLILASQRSSSDIISSRIKSNVLNAISFNMGSSNNYRTIFGHGINGLNLLGKGDGILKITGYHKDMQRFQSPIISPIEKEEVEVYEKLAHYLRKKYSKNKSEDEVVAKETKDEFEDEKLIKLKQVIANSGTTKTSELRKLLSIKNTTLIDLMNELVDQNWLKKESNSRGYELIADEEELNKYKLPFPQAESREG